MPRKVDLVAPGAGPLADDMAANLADFVSAFPAWIHTEGPNRGYPLSWQHYMIGMMSLGRRRARESLRTATATNVSNMADTARREYVAVNQRAAGWER
jgi:hypothetical protein